MRPSLALMRQALLDRPTQLLPHRQLVPVLDELDQFAVSHSEHRTRRPAGLAPSGWDLAVRLAAVAAFGGIPQAYPVPLGEEHIEADEVQVVGLLHDPAVVLGVLLQRVDLGERAGSNESVHD